ncbi:polymorphic toxin type 15 domain-containing protein [Actinomyces wuliandei]|uniref:polymorphic toxin type 15 domain-containing protein n=1 Tax=Actinomyces wuliandei TaxID=2057743 RepID=UPI000FD97313|nr:polymorphic toxin type 15 domain-containing protein [Actinomyces wuliandei]
MPGGGPAPGQGGGDGAALVASDMFTPGRAGGQGVLVWEGSVAAPDSPLAWHSSSPVEVFFHTGHHDSTRELAGELTRQLDRQLSALSLLSAQRLLEGIRAYRAQGRQPTSKTTRKRRKEFMKEVVRNLTRVHQLSDEEAVARAAEVDRALVVLHEPDQLLAGPGGPATTGPQPGCPSLGHGQVNSSVGGQNKPVVAVLEQAALQVPPQQRSRVRLLVGAVLTDSPDLAQDLRHGQVVLEPRTPGPGECHQPPGATVDTQPRRRHPRHRTHPLAPTTRAGARALGHDPARGRAAPPAGPARPRHHPARPHTDGRHHSGAAPGGRHPGRTGPAGPQDHPRGGPGRHRGPYRSEDPAARPGPHPTPGPHQKTPTQPRPRPLRPVPPAHNDWPPWQCGGERRRVGRPLSRHPTLCRHWP